MPARRSGARSPPMVVRMHSRTPKGCYCYESRRLSMKLSGVVSILALLGALAIASLAGAQVESTPIPQAPKPNLSPLSYLVGTWSCSTQSARRPAPFKTTVTYAMDPTGYWINEKSVTEPMSWFPTGLTSYDKITYDPQEKHWIDLSYDERGGYGYSVSQP